MNQTITHKAEISKIQNEKNQICSYFQNEFQSQAAKFLRIGREYFTIHEENMQII